MTSLHTLLVRLVEQPAYVVGVDVVVLLILLAAANRKMLVLILKNLSRNLLRTTLTSAAVVILVFVVTGIWSVLWFLDLITAEKTKDFKAIVTERWQVPSQMPFAYAAPLSEGAASHPGDVRPQDYMTWAFYGGTLDPAKKTRENMVFFFCMEPGKLLTMMDDLDRLQGRELEDLRAAVTRMDRDKRRVIVGRERLAALNKRVGERFTVTSINYADINLEFEITGVFPEGRYNQSAVMNRDYLNDALDAYKRDHKGTPHPLADKSLNLVFLRVPDSPGFRRMAEQIETSSQFTSPAVKCETASSGVASFLDAYRDLLAWVRWILVPVILVIMALIISMAISISVRERRLEMAVLKVLGFSPNHILALVLGEALLIGCASGFLSSAGTYLLVNNVFGGLPIRIAWMPAFWIPAAALWWGPILGGGTALAGSILPAWSARTVKVSEVFAKIT
jgi:putative ABC transport system permease protein